MPYMNKPCDKCSSSENYVYEKYNCIGDSSIPIEFDALGNIRPANLEYWCKNCLDKEEIKNAI